MGCDVNYCHPQQSGHTPLMVASQGGNADVVRCLMQHKADVNKTADPLSATSTDPDSELGDSEGWTCLHFAAWHGQTDVCKLLVGGEPSVPLRPRAASNSQLDANGTSPNRPVFEFLSLKDAAGRTASDLASFCGYRALGKLLRSTQQLYAQALRDEQNEEGSNAAAPPLATATNVTNSASSDTNSSAQTIGAGQNNNSLLATLARERRARRRGSETNATATTASTTTAPPPPIATSTGRRRPRQSQYRRADSDSTSTTSENTRWR